MSSKRVLITGGAGFVGSNLVKKMLHDGHEVHAILKNSTNKWRLDDVLAYTQVHDVDLADKGGLETLVKSIRPEYIYHLATRGSYSFQNNSDDIFGTNIVGTWNLLQATSKINYDLFVNVGSSSEYGFKDKAMHENDVLVPNSFYSATKASQSILCQQFAKGLDLPVVTMRLFSAFGPLEQDTRLIPTLISRALKNEDIQLSSPSSVRDFIYIDDAVRMLASIGNFPTGLWKGEIFNVGTGVQTSLKEVVQLVLEMTKSSSNCLWGEFEAKQWDTNVWVADVSKIKRVFDFSPISLREGLEKTINAAIKTNS